MGSRAEHGSSISITSGSTAMARAMHRRCCWPPDRPRPDAFRRSFTSSHSAAPRRDRSTMSSSSPFFLHAVDPGPEGDVVVDALRERVGLLEHHADAAAHLDRRRRPGRRGRCRGSMSVPSTRAPSMRSFMRLKQRSTVVLPQPDGPMNAVISCWRIVQVDVAHGAERRRSRRRGRRRRRRPAPSVSGPTGRARRHRASWSRRASSVAGGSVGRSVSHASVSVHLRHGPSPLLLVPVAQQDGEAVDHEITTSSTRGAAVTSESAPAWRAQEKI